jgi:hypothetical protein
MNSAFLEIAVLAIGLLALGLLTGHVVRDMWKDRFCCGMKPHNFKPLCDERGQLETDDGWRILECIDCHRRRLTP